MSPGRVQRGNPADRVRRQAETRALDEARTVPWKILADAAGEYTEWQAFALWLRALLDACEGLPVEVALEIEKRSPVLASRTRMPGNTSLSRGSRAWQDVIDWAESNIFVQAKGERWLNAVRYFSSKSLLSMKVWSYWEEIDRRWRDEKPEALPSYQQWMNATAAVSRLSNPESDAQKVLDSVRLIPELRWQQMLDAFLELTTLCLWMEILLGVGQAGKELVARELTIRYPRFASFSIQKAAAAISALTKWVIDCESPFAMAQPPLSALDYHLKCHPAYHARRRYAARCRGLWGDGHLDRLPSFAEWTDAADGFFER